MKYQVGDKIGSLTILSIERIHQGRKTRNYCICQCECGNIKRIRMDSISTQKGGTQSCGCYAKEYSRKRVQTHGQSNSPTYISWQSMRNRCYDPKNKSYNHYGGIGVIVCDRWKDSFENFLEDMGKRPSLEYSLDRIDVKGNYEPSNCRWATMKEQQNNRNNNIRLFYNGEEHTIDEWSSILGIKSSVIRVRLRRGKTVKEALSTVDNRKYHFKDK